MPERRPLRRFIHPIIGDNKKCFKLERQGGFLCFTNYALSPSSVTQIKWLGLWITKVGITLA
jgi:hypothetical protein